MTKKEQNLTENLTLDLRRGVVVLATLSELRQEQYGYALRERLAESGLEVPEGTLYPLLRRLESQGLLDSRWQLGEGRPRRYYSTSKLGRTALEGLNAEWTRLVAAIAGLSVED